MNERPVLFSAHALADAGGVIGVGAGACVLVDVAPTIRRELPILLATGDAARAHPLARGCEQVERPDALIIPGLVNAHTHLDLTHIGPQPHEPGDGFMKWIDLIRSRRETSAAGIAESVRVGIELSRRGGTVAVGDIAGAAAGVPTLVPWEVLRDSGMLGVSFLEFFAIGKGAERGVEAVGAVLKKWQSGKVAEWQSGGGKGSGGIAPPPAPAGEASRGFASDGGGVQLGLQPHAPNTVGLAGYRWAAEQSRAMGMPLCTHLAETWEEREFIAHARGPQRELLERIGIWDDAMLREIGAGRHPVEHMREVLAAARFLVAHVNDADDAAIRTLARTGTSVVYCPRASRYFGAERRFGPHRYREMMAAGVRVALGTDSMVNLDTPDRISVLDEMRLLHRRDATDPRVLLEMGTVNGAASLGMNIGWFRLLDSPRRIAGLTAVELRNSGRCPLEQAMLGESPPELLLDRNGSCVTGIDPI